MTTPRQPTGDAGDPSTWSRPAGPPPGYGPPGSGPTPGSPPSGYGPPPGYGPSGYGPPPGSPPPGYGPTVDYPADDAALVGESSQTGGGRRLRLGDPLSIGLSVDIVLALAVGGLIGGELYARNRGNEVVAQVVGCVVEDEATASFGPTPFLWQYATGHYGRIEISTAGNQLRGARGMTLDLRLEDVRTAETADSGGTVGAVDATITWSSAGIAQTVQGAIPLLGALVSGVSTDPEDGTLTLQGVLGTVVTRPEVVDGRVSLQVESVSGLGFPLPRETLQPFVDVFAGALTESYPLGIAAQSIDVTADGVVSRFADRDVTLPRRDDDPCFAGV